MLRRRPPIRVVIADPDRDLRRLLAALLAEESGALVVGQASDRQEALAATQRLLPDIVLLDESFTDRGFVSALKSTGKPAQVVVVGTDREGDAAAREAGACGYVLKSSWSVADEIRQALAAAVQRPLKQWTRGRKFPAVFRRRTVAFTVVAVALVLAVGFAASRYIDGEFEERAVNNVALVSTDNAEHIAARLTPEQMTTPLTGEAYDEFNRHMQEDVLDSRTIRVNVWSPGGTVIYSSGMAVHGKTFARTDAAFEKALLGETVTTSDVPYGPGHPEHAGLKPYVRLLEVHRPLVLEEAGIVGVLELYSDYEPIAAKVRSFQRIIYPVVIAALFCVALALVIFFRGATAAQRLPSLISGHRVGPRRWGPMTAVPGYAAAKRGQLAASPATSRDCWP